MSMRVNLQDFSGGKSDAFRTRVEEQVLELGTLRQIDAAHIRLERSAHSSPPFEVTAHLVTPGPDLFAHARDHTLAAAFGKALAQLRAKLQLRACRRTRRAETKLSAPPEKARPVRRRLSS